MQIFQFSATVSVANVIIVQSFQFFATVSVVENVIIAQNLFDPIDI